MYNAISCILC